MLKISLKFGDETKFFFASSVSFKKNGENSKLRLNFKNGCSIFDFNSVDDFIISEEV